MKSIQTTQKLELEIFLNTLIKPLLKIVLTNLNSEFIMFFTKLLDQNTEILMQTIDNSEKYFTEILEKEFTEIEIKYNQCEKEVEKMCMELAICHEEIMDDILYTLQEKMIKDLHEETLNGLMKLSNEQLDKKLWSNL